MSETKETDWPGPRVNFAAFKEDLAARRAALPQELALPRNAGKNRTASKKALLRSFEDAGGKW